MAQIRQSTLDTLAKLRLIPVISLPDSELAEPLGDALVEAGLPCAEITFRTEAAEESIHILSKRGDIFVAAGTVLSTEQAQQARDAGAQCLLSPGTDPTVIEWCRDNQVDIIPGVATPTDILLAMKLGLSTLKFFPADTMGGPSALGAMTAPFQGLRFVPTGGIGPENLADYLSLPGVLACGGSWMVPRGLLKQHDFEAVRERVSEAVGLVEATQ